MDDLSDIDEYLKNLQWKALSGIFYHSDIARNLQFQNKIIQLLNISLSTGTIATFFDKPDSNSANNDLILIVKISIPAALAIVNSYSIAFDISNRSYQHLDLAKDWRDQLEIVIAGIQESEEKKKKEILDNCKKRDAEIDKREPPLKYRLGIWAQHKAAKALGFKSGGDRGFFLKLFSFWW